jgi:hypothetical protein
MYATNNQMNNVPRPVMAAEAQLGHTPEVAREHSDLMNETERLAGTVKELLDRLRPVIRAVPSPECGVGPKREDCYSELGNGIRAASDRLRSEISRLRDVVETLAV